MSLIPYQRPTCHEEEQRVRSSIIDGGPESRGLATRQDRRRLDASTDQASGTSLPVFAATGTDKRIFGTNLLFTNYDFAAMARVADWMADFHPSFLL